MNNVCGIKVGRVKLQIGYRNLFDAVQNVHGFNETLVLAIVEIALVSGKLFQRLIRGSHAHT